LGYPSLTEVEQKVKNSTRLDFHLGLNEIPEEWNALRNEAKPMFKALNIFEADLKLINRGAI
jgi:hypothetical protein